MQFEDSSIDPDLARALQGFARLDAETATPQLGYVQRRRLLSELQASQIRRPLPCIDRQDHFLAASGREICVRSYAKPGQAGDKTLVWLHGGGWMVGDLNTHDDLCEHLAQFSGCSVLSVHYRRTPENPFPAALDDVMAVLHRLQRMPNRLPLVQSQVLLGGDSAGAHLALAAAVRQLQAAEQDTAQDETTARIAGLLLLYPPLLPDQDTPSMRAFASGFGLTPEAMRYYWQALGQPQGAAAQWRTPSLCTAQIAQLPPTVLMTASHDILRDEAEAFARQAIAAGAPLRLLRAPAMIHGFARMLAASPVARQQVELACCALLQALGQHNTAGK
ncbi:Alpha/beta hydrolase fold-3 domain-containing protein [Comamonas aquatilis]|uniref:alpha/beta hydrolase fold domain-containing protein n=1 Tax=Comamonas aquatilis TaxID=1778406 RepID=UPI0039EF3801